MNATTGTVGRRVREPRRAARIPKSRVHDARIGGIDDDFDGTDVLALVEDLLPRAAAVARAKHSALDIRGIEVTNRGNEHHVGILRIHGNLADVLRVAQAKVSPGGTRVRGFVDAVAEAGRVTQRGLPGADVDRVRGRRRDRQGADGGNRLIVEYRRPRSAGVSRFPDAAVHMAEVELVRPPGHAARGGAAATAERAEHAPVEPNRDGEWGEGSGS